jgi:hypothetical protein
VGSVCRVKRFQLGGKYFADEEVETEVLKWLRQQSKDVYATDFDALVTRWTSVSMLVEDTSRNKCFFRVRISHVLRFIFICDIFTDFPSSIYIYSRFLGSSVRDRYPATGLHTTNSSGTDSVVVLNVAFVITDRI